MRLLTTWSPDRPPRRPQGEPAAPAVANDDPEREADVLGDGIDAELNALGERLEDLLGQLFQLCDPGGWE